MTLLLAIRIAISSLALTLAAAAGERGLREAGAPIRWVWALAAGLTALITVVLLSGGSLPLAAPAGVGSGVETWVRVDGLSDAARVAARDASGPAGPSLGTLWIGLSALLVGWVVAVVLGQARRARRFPVRRVAGEEVAVTDGLGPAVTGLLRPRIMVPPWVLELPPSQQRLIVRHEAEHVAAGDGRLHAVVLLLACLLPWNPALWYQLRRLRGAIESDCDRRVLRGATTSLRNYALLLIKVAGRARRGDLLATSLLHPRNSLERRIGMITRHTRRPGLAVAWALGAAALLAVACAETSAPEPSEVDSQSASVLSPTGTYVTSAPSGGESPQVKGTFHVEQLRATELAEQDAATGGPVLERTRNGQSEFTATLGGVIREISAGEAVQFEVQVDDDGRATSIRFSDDTPEATRQRTREALQSVRFRVEGEDPEAWIPASLVLRQ